MPRFVALSIHPLLYRYMLAMSLLVLCGITLQAQEQLGTGGFVSLSGGVGYSNAAHVKIGVSHSRIREVVYTAPSYGYRIVNHTFQSALYADACLLDPDPVYALRFENWASWKKTGPLIAGAGLFFAGDGKYSGLGISAELGAQFVSRHWLRPQKISLMANRYYRQLSLKISYNFSYCFTPALRTRLAPHQITVSVFRIANRTRSGRMN